MTSIYRSHLGDSYQSLHPKLQHRYDITEQSSFHGTGRMENISGGTFLVRQLFKLGARYRLFFSERGSDVPFTIYNNAYENEAGEKLVKWNREFSFKGKKRYFDAVMQLNEKQDEIIDYFGIPHLLVSTLNFQVGNKGSMIITSKKQWLYAFGRKIPLPKFLYGEARIIESFDEGRNCYCVNANVSNPLLGTLFSYQGYFTEMESGKK